MKNPDQLRMSHVRIHEIKCWPEFFAAVRSGIKTFEVRLNDREYQVGDRLLIKEWDKDTECFTGNAVSRDVQYVTNYNQKDGYVVLGIK